jgi:hypothetical protein
MGFEHNGIQFFLVSICIFISFAMFPSEIIKSKIIIKIIKKLTNHTAGIYFIHVKLAINISEYIVPIKKRTINGCAIIYLLCYFICLIGSFIFGKTKLRHLFE